MKREYRKSYFEQTVVLSNEYAGSGAYCLTLESAAAGTSGCQPRAGQFYMLGLNDGIHILPRPISIYAFDEARSTVRFLYRPVGEGTRALSQYRTGEKMYIQGPLGNGFHVPPSGSYHIAVGGGIGLAPLPYLIRTIRSTNPKARILFFAGARDQGVHELLSFFDLPPDIKPFICTDDGSCGVKGFVPEALAEYLAKAQLPVNNIAALYACGPRIMLDKIAAFAISAGIPCQLSFERRMACGVRACMGCSIKTGAGIKKVCSDGPVFDARLFTLPHAHGEIDLENL